MSLLYSTRFQRFKEQHFANSLSIFINELPVSLRSFSSTRDGIVITSGIKQSTIFSFQLISARTYTLYFVDRTTFLNYQTYLQKVTGGESKPLDLIINESILKPLIGNDWSLKCQGSLFYIVNHNNQSLPLASARRIWNYVATLGSCAHESSFNKRPTLTPKPESTILYQVSNRAFALPERDEPSVEAQFEPDNGFDQQELEQ